MPFGLCPKRESEWGWAFTDEPPVIAMVTYIGWAMPGNRVPEENLVYLVVSALLRAGSTPVLEVSWVFSQALQLIPGAIPRNALARGRGAEMDSPS